MNRQRAIGNEVNRGLCFRTWACFPGCAVLLFVAPTPACDGRVASFGTPAPTSLDASPPVRDAAITFDAPPPTPPTTLASNTGAVYAIALDETSVYWLNGSGAVQSVPKAGGTVQTLTDQEGNADPECDFLALDATSIYWSTDLIYSAPRSGGRAVDLIGPPYDSPFDSSPSGGFAVGVSRLYFTSAFLTDQGTALLAVPKGGGAIVTLSAIPESGAGGGVVLDDTRAFWAGPGNAEIIASPIDGGAATVLAATALTLAPCSLSLDDQAVYWGDITAGTVMAVPKMGGAIVTLVSGLGQPYGVAVDSGNVYFTDGESGVVGRVPKGGGAVVTLDQGTQPTCIVTDATGVYWGIGEFIRSVPK